jgi:hypothetical protein
MEKKWTGKNGKYVSFKFESLRFKVLIYLRKSANSSAQLCVNPLKRIIFLLILFLCSKVHSQKYNDFSVSLHEEAINKVFTAIGEISGKSEYEVLLIKGEYTWRIVNPKINLKPDSSDFTCDAKVEVGPFNYKTQVVGNVKITYDARKNEISIKITRAIFELYTVVFENKIHIKDIHLEDQFKDPFIFEGPKTLATDMSFTMPDSTIRKIYVQPNDCEMKVKLHEICTYCEIVASDKPFKPLVKALPPIQAADKPKTAVTPTNTAQKK